MSTIEHPVLYSRDSTGKIRTWRLEHDGGDKYRSIQGILGGTQTPSGWTTCGSKNVGRSNATTAFEQVQAEIAAEYKKKLKRGHFEDVNAVDSGTQLFPMLANKYADLKKGLDFGEVIYTQRKLDGIRMIGRASGLFTRKAEPIVSVPLIAEVLALFHKDYPHISIDGELYSHDLRDDLPKINSIVRKQTPTEADLKESAKLQYHVYDLYDERYPDMQQDERNELLRDFFKYYFDGSELFQQVDTYLVQDQAHLDGLYDTFRKEGFEGQIIRLNGPYEPKKRSKNLLKRKEYMDEEFTVVDILEGNGNWSGAAKAVVCRMKDGKEFESGLAGTYEDNAVLLAERQRYIGADVTVTFFKYTPKGVPSQGVAKAFYIGGRNV